jgi:stage II sporulation protein D
MIRTRRSFFVWQGLLAVSLLLEGRPSSAIPVHPRKMASELKIDSETIRVRLSNLGRVLVVKGEGLALSLAQKPEIGNVLADEWLIDCKRSMLFDPATQRSRQIPKSGILIESSSGVLSLNERRFRDQVVIYPQGLRSPYDRSQRTNPECLVVNHINLERYLESVVNGEFNSQWADQAVEAQVIAARTYALFQMNAMRKDRGKVYDVESTQKDQVYLGLDRVDSKASEVVARTRGLILSPKEGKGAIKAFYHASCGGTTIAPEQVWKTPFKGFPRGVRCGFCDRSPSYQWEYQLSFVELEKKLWNGIQKDSVNRKAWPKAYLESPSRWILSKVRALQEVTGPKTGRIEDLEFSFIDRENFSKQIKVVMNAYTARNWIDPAKLKSTWFQLSTRGRSLAFEGKGSGHGVGMCQWGAKAMGEKGFTRDQILLHYYPGVKIARISR